MPSQRGTVGKCAAIAISLALCCARLLAQNAPRIPADPSPGKAIQAAAQASVQDRHPTGTVDILSATQGVDFGPYLRDRVLPMIRANWYRLIPESMQMKKGKLAIEFAITKHGEIAGMKLVAASGDVALDRAAWLGIASSNPFPPLPEKFTGEHLALRIRFYYNPEKTELAEVNSAFSAPAITHAVLLAHDADANPPKYPKKAHKAKAEGIVRLEAEVGTDGKIKELKVMEGDPMLADASLKAIRKWRFYPAQRSGRPVEDKVNVRVEFRLDREQVRAELVPYHDPSPSLAQ